jgi:hypothetical protein
MASTDSATPATPPQHFHPAFVVGVIDETLIALRGVSDQQQIRRALAELRTITAMVGPEFDAAVERGRQHARMDELLNGPAGIPARRRLGRGLDSLVGGDDASR